MDKSPWPLFVASAVHNSIYGGWYFLNFSSCAQPDRFFTGEGSFSMDILSHIICTHMTFIGIPSFIIFVAAWSHNIVIESTYEGQHTKKVRSGLIYGFALFIVSEAMLFFSFIWSILYFSISPSIWIGGVWPPRSVTVPNADHVPALNTAILIQSGFSVTWSHKAFRRGDRKNAILGMVVTLVLGVTFSVLQFYEYFEANYFFESGVYASVVYLTTGFHGIHVIAGSLFLLGALYRMVANHFFRTIHLGLDFAIWYWHFVDIIWIVLYYLLYYWSC